MRDLKGVLLCAIGRETAKSLRNFGINADIIPDEYSSEALITMFKEKILNFQLSAFSLKILYPRSDIALKGFVEEMEKIGIQVDAPVTYRTIKPTEHGKRLARFLREGKITIATFTSPSSFNNLIDILKDDALNMLKEVAIAVIGKTTAKAVEEAGYRVSIIPEKSTIKHMVEAIIKWVQQK